MTIEELNPKKYELTPDIEKNLLDLAEKITALEMVYGDKFIVTSGLRSKADQMRINPSVKNSAHLMGMAVDVSDPEGRIDEWCLDNLEELIRIGLYLESPVQTVRWSHLQSRKPISGNRVFVP